MKTKSIKTADIVWVVIGIVFSALFVIFSTPFYELLYMDGEFSNEMYNNNMYLVVACYTTLLVWFFAVLFYWIIDSIHFAHFWVWFLLVVLVTALSPCVVHYYVGDYLNENNLDLLFIPLRNFNIINTFVTLVYFVILSICFRRLSVHCSTTPF